MNKRKYYLSNTDVRRQINYCDAIESVAITNELKKEILHASLGALMQLSFVNLPKPNLLESTKIRHTFNITLNAY